MAPKRRFIPTFFFIKKNRLDFRISYQIDFHNRLLVVYTLGKMCSWDLCCQFDEGKFHKMCACKEQHCMDQTVNRGILGTSVTNLNCPIPVQHPKFSANHNKEKEN